MISKIIPSNLVTLMDMSHTLFYFILLSSDENLPQNKCCLDLAIFSFKELE
jgi:hypothetical protein